ncbi:MAG: hypothetical protein II393_03585, partial [Cytophagales bacterium]|nr:hypothetical protein [Cytophagales bacterium]
MFLKIFLFSFATSFSFLCCKNCCKKQYPEDKGGEMINNVDIQSPTTTESLPHNPTTTEEILPPPTKKIQPLYDLKHHINLNEIGLQGDLENIFIQLLSERLHEYMEACSSEKIRVNYDGNNRRLNFNKKITDDILEQVDTFLKNKRDKFFFKDIQLIDKSTFANIDNEYIKLLATFFLKDEDYEKYIQEYLECHNDNNKNEKSFNTDIFKELSKDENFIQLLCDHEATNRVLKTEEADTVTSNLLRCPPYDGMTYRGTGLYSDHGERIDLKATWGDNIAIISKFIGLIENCTWEEPGLKPYSANQAIAGFFAMNYCGHNDNFFKFRILIRNHVNKTGVELLNFYDAS